MYCSYCNRASHTVDECWFAHPELRRSKVPRPKPTLQGSVTLEQSHSLRRHPERDTEHAPETSTDRPPSISTKSQRIAECDDGLPDHSLELSDLRALEDMLGPGIRDAARENKRQEQVVIDLRAEIKSLHERLAEVSSRCVWLEREKEQSASTREASTHRLKTLEADLRAAHTREQEQEQIARVANEAAEKFAAEISSLCQSQAILVQERNEAYLKAQQASQELGEIRVSLQADVISYDGEQHDEFTELLKRAQACQEKRKHHTACLLQRISQAFPLEEPNHLAKRHKIEKDGGNETDRSDLIDAGATEPSVSSDNSSVILERSSPPTRDPRKRRRLDRSASTPPDTN